MCAMTLRTTRDERDSIDLGTPRLYREDLEQIARIVRDECDGQVTIEFFDKRGRVGDAPTAFAEHHAQEDTTENLERLTISGERGGTELEVSFSPAESRLIVTNPDNSARGAAGQIHQICVAHRRYRLRWLRLGDIGLVAAGGALGVVLAGDWRVGLVSLVAAYTALSLPWVRSWLEPRTLLVNAPRVERPSWWQRHRKDALLLLIGGCIGYGVNQVPALAQLLSG